MPSLQTFFEKSFFVVKLPLLLALVALMAAFATSGFSDGPMPAERNRTKASHAVIKSCLEQYKEKHGEYPTPAHPDAMIEISGKQVRVGTARMLYQMATGDGDNEIKSASSTGTASDGKLSEEEFKNTINGNLPKNIIVKSDGGYYLQDGWGRPFQYTKGGGEDAVNATFDLWSFGDTHSKGTFFRAPAPAPFYDAESRRNVEATSRWIKNW
jgi:type II secretory pathway pseudopilin PulG